MKREGYIIEEIIEYANLSESFNQVLRGKKRKRSRQGRLLLSRREEVLQELKEKIGNGTFRISDYRERDIIEGGKQRRIQILPMYDRIGIHAIMTVVDRHIRKRLIRTTSASITRRGMHDLMNYIRDDIRQHPADTKYCYKIDVHHFYESVDQEKMLQCIQRYFKDTRLLAMLDNFIHMMPKGISIGLRSSQSMGNLFLSHYLDHLIKDEEGEDHYYRYCDDIVILTRRKERLWQLRETINQQLEKAGLLLNKNERVFPTAEGIDFLGYVIYPHHVLLRKRIKQKSARRLNRVKSRKRRKQLIASLYGMAKHANCNHLFKKLTMDSFRDFKSLNVVYRPADGKKRFQGQLMSLRELVNLKIIVKDFETGIKTSQGEDRCVVSFELNGEPKKFFTASTEMQDILHQIDKLDNGFPFTTVIKSEVFGHGQTKYLFT